MCSEKTWLWEFCLHAKPVTAMQDHVVASGDEELEWHGNGDILTRLWIKTDAWLWRILGNYEAKVGCNGNPSICRYACWSCGAR